MRKLNSYVLVKTS